MMARGWTIVFIALAVGCGKTEECKRLAGMLEANERILVGVRARAGSVERVEKQAIEAEKKAKALMTELGLDQPETKIAAELQKRVAQFKGAKMERKTRPNPEASGPNAPNSHQTFWEVTFKERNQKRAYDIALSIAQGPPLLGFATLLQDPKSNAWTLEINRVSVIEVPLNLKPQPVPALSDPTTVPSNFGFCGASGLRDKLESVAKEVAEKKEAAESTTVLLPKMATYNGLYNRAQVAAVKESEARRIIRHFLDAVQKAKVTIKGVGAEGEVVILELFGGKKDRIRLERQLEEKVLEALKVVPPSKPGTVRMLVANRVNEMQRKSKRPGSIQSQLPQLPKKRR